MTSADLIRVIQARGSDATDLRDAAHEAAHALKWNVKKRWTRDNIHAKKPRGINHGVADELEARAVEQIVCKRLNVRCGSIAKWAEVCWEEMYMNERIALPSSRWVAARVRDRITDPEALALADRVLALEAP